MIMIHWTNLQGCRKVRTYDNKGIPKFRYFIQFNLSLNKTPLTINFKVEKEQPPKGLQLILCTNVHRLLFSHLHV